jgi:hypothetical protein
MSSSSSITTARRAAVSFAAERDGAGDLRRAALRGTVLGFDAGAADFGGADFDAADANFGAAVFEEVGGCDVDGFAATVVLAAADVLGCGLDFAGAADRADSAGAAAALDPRVELPMMIPPFRSPGSPHR